MFRNANTFSYKWTIHNFHCEMLTYGEALPSTTFKFNFDRIEFTGKLYLYGDECRKRQCKLYLMKSYYDPYNQKTYWIDLYIGDNRIGSRDCSNFCKEEIFDLWPSCPLIKHLRNNEFTITCTITFSWSSLMNFELPSSSESFRTEHNFIYKWTIDAFDCKKVKNGEFLPFKDFEFDFGPDAKFSGHLYFQGDKCEERECILSLEGNTREPWRVWVDLGFRDDVKDSYGMAFTKVNNRKTWKLFDVGMNRCLLTKHLQNNSFTIACIITYVTYEKHEHKMNSLALKNQAEIPALKSEVSLTKLKISDASHCCRMQRKFTHKWTIKDVDCKKLSIGENLPSKKFEFIFGPEAKFNGQLYLQGDECEKRECILSLQRNTEEDWRAWVDLGFGDGVSDSYGMAFSKAEDRKIWKLFEVNMNECLLTKHIKNNAFTITCIITYVIYKELSILSTIDWDVTFVVQGYEFCAHKSILADHSKVFAVMFEREIDESNKITLSDINPKVFQDMLRYIYTSEVIEVTLELLTACDLYDLPKLKAVCENELECKVSNELLLQNEIEMSAPKSEMILRKLKTSDASHSCRMQRKFTYKWTIQNFDCKKVKNGEILPSKNFEFDFGPDAKFSGQLYLQGEDCEKRECILCLQRSTEDDWRAWVDIGFGDEVLESYGMAFNVADNKKIWKLFEVNMNECLSTKHIKNNAFTITCIITYITYEEHELSNQSTMDPAVLHETEINALPLESNVETASAKSIMSLTKLKTFAASHSCRIQKQFTYKWTIQNFDCKSVPKGDILPFKKFEFNFGPGAEFRGKLYLRGKECANRKCSLSLQHNTEEDWRVWVDFSLADDMAYNSGVDLDNAYNTADFYLYINNECLLDKYQRKNTLTITCVITYVTYEQQEFPNFPTITHPAELNEYKMSSTNLITSDASCTCRIEKKFTYKWIIKDFYCEKITNGEILPSIEFEFDFGPNAKFNGQLSLAGDYCKSRECILELNSTTLDNWGVLVHLGFVDDETCHYKYREVLNNGLEEVRWSLFNTFRNKCFLEKSLRNKTSAIVCNIFYVTYEETKLPTINPPELYESNMNYDVTFVVEGHELHAHKSILAERNKVLTSMFAPEIEEAKSNKIHVNDVDFRVFQEILCFIYTGKVDKVTLELLAASDKYDLPELKTICENELMEKVSNETAAETLLMADIYNVPKLKEHTIIYIKDHLVAVTATEGWHKLVKNHHNIFAEVWK